MEKEKELTLKDEMESKTFVTVKLNNVPLKFWEEFKKDAEENFANNYIMKIMNDHLRRKEKDAPLIEVIKQLQERLDYIEEKVIGTTAEIEKKMVKAIHGFGKREE